MARQSWTRRLIRILVLVASGATLMSTGTSCGDQIRQSMMDAGVNFVGQTTGQVLQSVISGLLGVQTQA